MEKHTDCIQGREVLCVEGYTVAVSFPTADDPDAVSDIKRILYGQNSLMKKDVKICKNT